MVLEKLIGVSLATVNVLAGAIVAYTQLAYYFHCRGATWCWVKFGLGVMGLYWAALYVFVILQTLGILPPADSIWFGRIFVRPAITLTLGLIAAGGIVRWKHLVKPKEG